MKKTVLNLKGAEELSKNEQKSISGGIGTIKKCGGDGSYIFVNGVKVCCYIPSNGTYIC
ncbi:MAG: hypothetical protein KDD04_08310 [Sinomicrobium sp.]|nr:hypothetical protein [Sinomicrobium sp.]